MEKHCETDNREIQEICEMTENQIPKVIHFCWFGGGELPRLAKKCMASWKRYCPDYEIKLWNESNFDYRSCAYAAEAYEEKKWAFVSDYARFKILYENGGIYFDTDVELCRPMEELISAGGFMGTEEDGVNPGLGMAALRGNVFLKELLSDYENRHFDRIAKSGELDTIVTYTTNKLMEKGLKLPVEEITEVDGIKIYPRDYFGAFDLNTGRVHRTEHTYAIHHYAASWCDPMSVFRGRVARVLYRIGGERLVDVFRRR